MNNYNTLVSKVLNKTPLAEEVDNLVVGGKCLNLVSKDWLSRLENNITYQDFANFSKNLWKLSKTTPYYEYEDSKLPYFHVVVVGYCQFLKPYDKEKKTKPTINVLNCEPLSKIARAMTSDLDPQVQISNDYKFTFERCGTEGCADCRYYFHKFTEAGYKINEMNQPCISDTKVFDGKRVVNRFHSQLQSMFDNDLCLCIMRLNINVRYNFQDSNKQKVYKISGTVSDIVGFNENKLTLTKKVDIGPLTNFSDNKKCEKLSQEQIENDPIENFLMTDDDKNERQPSNFSDNKKCEKLSEEQTENDTIENFLMTDDENERQLSTEETRKRKDFGNNIEKFKFKRMKCIKEENEKVEEILKNNECDDNDDFDDFLIDEEKFKSNFTEKTDNCEIENVLLI